MRQFDIGRANRHPIRADLELIAGMVEPGTRVLDIGCGDGGLLDVLIHERRAIARGIEISQEGVNACVRGGLSVIQGDADTDLKDYPSNAFDTVILSQTLQATHAPRSVLGNLVRIGRHAIVSFPNFGHWRLRLRLLISGRMPASPSLPESWHSTGNIHLCTIRDFLELCDELNISVERFVALDGSGDRKRIASPWLANLMAENALFLLTKGKGAETDVNM